MLKEGDKAPDFRARTDSGEEFQLPQLKGKRVVLYFYPRANTPGCTIEACEFRDHAEQFSQRDTVIVGVSPDKPDAQAKFKRNRRLPFTLLADTDKTAAQSYGVWKEKQNYGKSYMGIERTTFLLDSAGKLARIFPKVKPAEHHTEVLEALKSVP